MAYKKKEKKSLLLYYDYIDQFEMLSDSQLRQLIYAMIHYDKTGEINELDGITKMAFLPIKRRLIQDKETWENTCKINSENAKKRWGKKVCDGMQLNTTVCDGMQVYANYADIDIDKDIDRDKDKDKDIDSDSVNNNNNAPITLTELIEFGKTINASEQYCEKFYNTYESTNWINKNGQKITNAKSLLKIWINEDKSKLNNPEWFNKDIDQNIATLEEQQNFEEKLEKLRRG